MRLFSAYWTPYLFLSRYLFKQLSRVAKVLILDFSMKSGIDESG